MRALWIEPGSVVSTKDVSDGFREALIAQGHDVGRYALDRHLVEAQDYLLHKWRMAGKPETKPNRYDVLWLAGCEILPRALKYEADWVVVVAGANMNPDWFVLLRRAGVKTAILLTESPYEDGPQAVMAAQATVCFTNERASVPALRKVQPHTYYMAHAFDPGKHHPEAGDESVAAHDVLMVGTGWRERIETLGAVNWDGIDLGLYGGWRLLGSRHHLRRYVCGSEMPNAQAVALYRRAKIGMNLYRTRMAQGHDTEYAESAESLNPRALELAACGVFTLSDWRPEVSEVFGDAVPTFRTPRELEELVRYYLAHNDERRELAARLPGLVAGHTFDARAKEMVSILEQQQSKGRD